MWLPSTLGDFSQDQNDPDLSQVPFSNFLRIATHARDRIRSVYKTCRAEENKAKLSSPSLDAININPARLQPFFMQAVTSLHVGTQAPDFTAPTTSGKIIHLSDYKGKKVVLYFYPKDDTPGCTVEACGLRDQYQKIRDLGAEVLGVSIDNTESHKQFTTKYNLPFQLVADTDKNITKTYGVYNEKWNMAKRVTFLIDEQGRILKVFDTVKPDQHPQEIIEALRSKR